MSPFYNFGASRIEITHCNSSSVILCLPDVAETCVNFVATLWFLQAYPLLRMRVLASRCLAMDVSAVLLWLHGSGVHASYHSIYCREKGNLFRNIMWFLLLERTKTFTTIRFWLLCEGETRDDLDTQLPSNIQCFVSDHKHVLYPIDDNELHVTGIRFWFATKARVDTHLILTWGSGIFLSRPIEQVLNLCLCKI
jgi:hypothetical protein